MEVRAGYKQTEVGVIPEDWTTPPLGSITTLMTNGYVGPVTNHYALNDNGVLYIQGYNVEENAFNFHGIKYVTEDFHRSHLKSCLRCGDLLTIQTGEIGLTTIVPENLSGSNCHALIISRFDKKRVTPAFMSYYLNSKPGRSRLKLIETGTTMKHLNVGDMLHFIVPLPPTLSEQEAIAGVLSDADALIESLEQLIDKKRLVKQGAMQELITGKRRLPGFEVKPGYKKTEVGVIPEDWDICSLGKVVTFLDGLRRPVKDADRAKMQGSIPYYGASGIVDYVNDYLFDEDLILLGEDGENILSRSCRLAFRVSGKVWVNNHAHVLRPNPGISIGYLTDYLESLNYEQYNSGTAQPKLNQQTCYRIPVMLPPTLDEQEGIAAILSDMDAEIAALEEKLAKARLVKQGMMQELLTGRIRLV